MFMPNRLIRCIGRFTIDRRATKFRSLSSAVRPELTKFDSHGAHAKTVFYMSLTWIILEDETSGESDAEDVEPELLQRMCALLKQNGGVFDSSTPSKIDVLTFDAGVYCTITLEASHTCVSEVYVCWDDRGRDTMWSLASARQRFLGGGGRVRRARDLGPRPAAAPWFAVATSHSDGGSDQQIHLELALSWAAILVFGADTLPQKLEASEYLSAFQTG